MCSHAYTADYSTRIAMGERCPYPAFFAGLPAAHRATLPRDADGLCIFHSTDAEWKREHDFGGWFGRLAGLLDDHDSARRYDFAEFVFVGDRRDAGEPPRLRIADTAFRKHAQFIGARFLDAVEMERVDFAGGAEFEHAEFAGELRMTASRLNGAGFDGARFMCAWFADVEFSSYAEFSGAHFGGTDAGGYCARFYECRFRGLTTFVGARFEPENKSMARFERVLFGDFTDFREARFRCLASFTSVTFADTTEFIDTRFEVVDSTARYAGATAAEFVGVRLPETGMIDFRSTDPARPLFTHEMEITFAGEPEGRVYFENANLSRLFPASRARLLELAKLGRIEIGRGCIKYRVQTEPRTVAAAADNAPLVVELCQTFSTYFTAHHGLNLGFEILSRDAERITFFYFTDEDVSEAEFLARLAETERELWNLLSLSSPAQLTALPGVAAAESLSRVADAGDPAPRESAVVNAVDGLSALVGTFFRVGVRIAMGRWHERDTRALLGAIQFNDGAELRAAALHRTLADRYTGTTLAELNLRQNALLPPIHPAGPEVRVVFLAANSIVRPLDLDRELERIQTNLKLGSKRAALVPVLAASVDRFTQAMLDEAPTIVHFSGHGERDGIVLRDERDGERIVSGEALAELFALFPGTVQCVVLNACWSDAQARAIRRHVPHVVGMKDQVPDETAVAFSSGFYKAIGAGRTVKFAFDLGMARARTEGGDWADLIVLL